MGRLTAQNGQNGAGAKENRALVAGTTLEGDFYTRRGHAAWDGTLVVRWRVVARVQFGEDRGAEGETVCFWPLLSFHLPFFALTFSRVRLGWVGRDKRLAEWG